MNDKKNDKIINLGCKSGCGTCNEKSTDAFIENIEEEIRQENWQRLWDKYGKFITYASCVILAGAGFYGMWQRQDMADREAISAKYTEVQMNLMSGNPGIALNQLREISNVSKKEYAILAKLDYAAIMRDQGDKKALAEFKSIYSDQKAHELYRGIAYIFYVNAALDLMTQAEIVTALPEFIKDLKASYKGKAWDIMAKESLAFCYIKQGDKESAKQTLTEIAKSTNVPEAMLERCKILLHSLEA